jgi:ribonuclease T2
MSRIMPGRKHVAVVVLVAAALLALAGCRNQTRGETSLAGSGDDRGAQSGEQAAQPAGTSGNFDYYILVLSWAPEFCATHPDNASSSECDPHRHLGFVVHGMWPQNDNGDYPLNCGSAPPVSQATVRRMLDIIPSRGLIQHEWRTHGTCTGLNANDYFANIERAYGNLHIPDEFKTLAQEEKESPADIGAKFAQANHVPTSAVRVSCSGDELLGVEVCLTKDLQYRSCGSKVRDCRAPQVLIRPTP